LRQIFEKTSNLTAVPAIFNQTKKMVIGERFLEFYLLSRSRWFSQHADLCWPGNQFAGHRLVATTKTKKPSDFIIEIRLGQMRGFFETGQMTPAERLVFC
jgi:hypothetical protein